MMFEPSGSSVTIRVVVPGMRRPCRLRRTPTVVAFGQRYRCNRGSSGSELPSCIKLLLGLGIEFLSPTFGEQFTNR